MQQEEQEIPTGTEKLLLVDDEEALVGMLEELLSSLGYSIVAARSSQEALEIFRENPEEFDMVITDQGMPKMKGTQLAKELRAIRKTVPIILCTGFSESLSKGMAKKLGIRKILMKPVTMREIAASIREILDG